MRHLCRLPPPYPPPYALKYSRSASALKHPGAFENSGSRSTPTENIKGNSPHHPSTMHRPLLLSMSVSLRRRRHRLRRRRCRPRDGSLVFLLLQGGGSSFLVLLVQGEGRPFLLLLLQGESRPLLLLLLQGECSPLPRVLVVVLAEFCPDTRPSCVRRLLPPEGSSPSGKSFLVLPCTRVVRTRRCHHHNYNTSWILVPSH